MYNNFKLTKKIPNNKDFISIINKNNYANSIQDEEAITKNLNQRSLFKPSIIMDKLNNS